MATAKELILKRNECEKLLNIANDNMSKDNYLQALTMYKNAVIRAEEIFRLSKIDQDRELVIKVYTAIAKYYRIMYQATGSGTESYQAITYYERIIFLYNEALDLADSEHRIIYLKSLMENYVQLIKISLDTKSYPIYKEYSPIAYKCAKLLIKENPVYESEQYVILLDVFNGDYFRFQKKYKRALVWYYVGCNKLQKIYDDFPKEEIKNDLIAIYTSLYEISLLLNRNRLKKRYKEKILELKGELK